MRRTWTILIAVVLCLSLLIGCGGKTTGDGKQDQQETTAPAQTTQTTPEEKPSEPVVLTHWYWADNEAWTNSIKKAAEDFNATNGKNITVKLEEYPWDGGGYSENLFTAVMGGGGPDTSQFKLTSTPLFTANNLIVNLEEYVKNWDKKDKIDDNIYSIMRSASEDNQLHVMPFCIQVLYVYYRPSMFKEAGIDIPKTYDEFLEACKLLTRDTNGDGKTDVYGFGMRGATNGHEPWSSFIHAAGGNLQDLTSPEAVRGMQDFIDLYKNGYVPPTAPTDGFNEIIANFKSGLTAMVVHHTGSFQGMVDTFGDDVSAFQFPGGKGRWTSMGDTNTVMFEKCANKEAAFEWLSYLATGKGQEIWCVGTGNIPVSVDVQNLDFFQQNRFYKASIDGIGFAGIFPIREKTTEFITTTWPTYTQKALLGEVTAEQALAEMQKVLWG
jgi:multiple sugar transport system substrate-binding protein